MELECHSLQILSIYICVQSKQSIRSIYMACIGHTSSMFLINVSQCNTVYCRCVHTMCTVVKKHTINYSIKTVSVQLHLRSKPGSSSSWNNIHDGAERCRCGIPPSPDSKPERTTVTEAQWTNTRHKTGM